MKFCDRCRVPGCCLTYLGEACAKARKEFCPDIQPNNAELVSNMGLEELAVFLASWAKAPESWMANIGEVRKWLKDEPSHTP